jgi:hypothetical protein
LLTLPFFIDIEELLRSLIFFIIEIDPTSLSDPSAALTVDGTPNKKRQNLLRECRYIDLLIDCLRYPFNEGLYMFNDLTGKTPITRICRLIYRLLKHCVVDSPANKKYVGKQINLFFRQDMLTTNDNNFNAAETIRELLKDNSEMLEEQINE